MPTKAELQQAVQDAREAGRMEAKLEDFQNDLRLLRKDFNIGMDGLRKQVEKVSNDLKEHQLLCHRGSNGNGKWFQHAAVKYGGGGVIGGATLLELIHGFLSFLKGT